MVLIQKLQLQGTPMTEKEDIYPSVFSEHDLEGKDLKSLRKEVEAKAIDAIDWYIKRKQIKSIGSKILRIGAILFILIGAMLPILKGIDWLQLEDCHYGYIALALAGTCIVIDKFMGFSSSWMRYMTTGISLQKALIDFQTDWMLMWAEVTDNTPTVEQQRRLLQRIKSFRLKIITEIERETQLWTNEFQSNLSQMDIITTQREHSRPGVVELIITNGELAEQGLTAVVDGITVGYTRGQRLQIGHIFPGQHDIVVHGVVNGKEIQASNVINMTAGGVVELRLTLPIDSAE